MIPITVAVPENKSDFFRELIHSLHFEEIETETNANFEIPESHKKLVLDRIEKSKPENLIPWESIENTFDLGG